MSCQKCQGRVVIKHPAVEPSSDVARLTFPPTGATFINERSRNFPAWSLGLCGRGRNASGNADTQEQVDHSVPRFEAGFLKSTAVSIRKEGLRRPRRTFEDWVHSRSLIVRTALDLV